MWEMFEKERKFTFPHEEVCSLIKEDYYCDQRASRNVSSSPLDIV